MLWWSDSLKTGNVKVDTQHKKIFELGTGVLDLTPESSNETLQETFQELIDYTKKHFAEEEKMMGDHGYSKLQEHQGLHREFIQKLHNTLQDFKASGPTEENVDNLKLLMVDWLINHINEADKNFIQKL
ncbi:bacteriohemerythrin [Isachenkonia alkalipeptolytica]|uniref:Bacteriohemerythrin n=1 Tax=Isachenkonia alkalipeptolytica TaxID=2565777 RepID=A0AA43XKJ4_9CLOT|nr:hemerythrin family protein [Isachenkonia alkalipeptolytica]NBG88412.1 bacteriohemerythrin [Isachenkonia alkalipeptolytica]